MNMYWITWFDCNNDSVGSIDEMAKSAEELHEKYHVEDYENAEYITICVAD